MLVAVEKREVRVVGVRGDSGDTGGESTLPLDDNLGRDLLRFNGGGLLFRWPLFNRVRSFG